MKAYSVQTNSGEDWLGHVPKHWTRTKVFGITRVVSEKGRPDLQMLSVYREYGVIQRKDDDENHNVIPEDLTNNKVVRPGQLVLNKMKTWQGSLGVSEFEGIVSPAYIVCNLHGGHNPRFIHYLLRCRPYVFAWNRISYGVRSNQWDMRYADFKQVPLFLPPRAEQDAIVEFLEAKGRETATFIANKNRLIELLKEQKTALINQAVTRGLNPNLPFKPSGIPWLADIPKHWEVKKIGYIGRVGNGSTPNRGNPAYWTDGTYPWLNSGSVNQNVINRADQFVTDTALKECHLPIVPANSVLIAITGQGKTRGTAALLTFEATINQHIAYILTVNPLISPQYLHCLLTGLYSQLRAISDGEGSTKGALTCEELKRFKLPLPPPPEQKVILEQIAMDTKLANAAIAAAEREIELMEEYRKTLIAAAVTGKIDVRGAICG